MITCAEGFESLVFGVPDDDFLIQYAEIENAPPDMQGWKIRLRPKREGKIFIKTPGKITEYVIGFENGKIKLLIKRGENITK